MCIIVYLGPHKQSVIERFLLLGEFVIRGSTVHVHMYTCCIVSVVIFVRT